MEGLVSDNKIHESKELGLLNFEVTVTLFFCVRVESSKRSLLSGGTFTFGAQYGGKKINITLVESLFSEPSTVTFGILRYLQSSL